MRVERGDRGGVCHSFVSSSRRICAVNPLGRGVVGDRLLLTGHTPERAKSEQMPSQCNGFGFNFGERHPARLVPPRGSGMRVIQLDSGLSRSVSERSFGERGWQTGMTVGKTEDERARGRARGSRYAKPASDT